MYLPATGASERPSNAPPPYAADETETAFLTDVFLDWLAAQPAGEPWFAHLSYLAPHPPYVVPEPFNALYDPAEGPSFRRAESPAGDAAVHPLVAYWHATSRRDDGYIIGAGNGRVADWSDADFRVIRSIYWGMISEVDAQIGRVLDGLNAAGAADNTVIVITSDHAEMLGDHWALGKFGYFDQSFHVPLIIAIRDGRPGDGSGLSASRSTSCRRSSSLRAGIRPRPSRRAFARPLPGRRNAAVLA